MTNTRFTTNNAGNPVASDDTSLTAGAQGPSCCTTIISSRSLHISTVSVSPSGWFTRRVAAPSANSSSPRT